MEDQKDMARTNVYLEFAKEHYAWDRHHESQRQNVCMIIMVFSGLLLSVIKFSSTLSFSNEMIGIVIFVVGLFGCLFVYKQYERMKYHKSKYEYYRDLLGSYLDIDFNGEYKNLDNDDVYSRFPRMLKKISLHYYWSFLMTLISAIGLYIIFNS